MTICRFNRKNLQINTTNQMHLRMSYQCLLKKKNSNNKKNHCQVQTGRIYHEFTIQCSQDIITICLCACLRRGLNFREGNECNKYLSGIQRKQRRKSKHQEQWWIGYKLEVYYIWYPTVGLSSIMGKKHSL